MNLIKQIEGVDKEHREKAMEIAKPLTPRSERSRRSWGSLILPVPDNGCPSVKCVRHAGHPGKCWPREDD